MQGPCKICHAKYKIFNYIKRAILQIFADYGSFCILKECNSKIETNKHLLFMTMYSNSTIYQNALDSKRIELGAGPLIQLHRATH